MNKILKQIGKTQDGKPVISGIWKLYIQEGFPVELSFLKLSEMGCVVGWYNEIKHAAETNTLPSLFNQMESFMNGEAIEAIKQRCSIPEVLKTLV